MRPIEHAEVTTVRTPIRRFVAAMAISFAAGAFVGSCGTPLYPERPAVTYEVDR